MKRNQELIIKHLWTQRNDVIDIADIDDNSNPEINEQRKALLTRKHSGDDKQTYHLHLVKLMAATCEGENRQIEAMCRSIFTLEELMETIALDGSPGEDNVAHISKGPYIAFFLWAYLNAGSSSVEIGTDKLHSEPKVFASFGNIASEEVAAYGNNRLTDAQSEFVYDIFIPCTSKLVEHHFPKDQASQRHLFDVALVVSDFLNTALSGGDTSGIDRFRAQHAVELFNSLNKKLLNSGQQHSTTVMIQPSVEERRRFEQAYDSVNKVALKLSAGVANNAAMAANRERYKEEEKTNLQFNNFVVHLSTLYKSRNTVEAQLPHASQTLEEEARLQPYCGEPGSDASLPLGPEFQHLLSLFAKIDTKGELELNLDRLRILTRLFSAHQSSVATSEQDRNAKARVSVKMLSVVCTAVHNIKTLGLDLECVMNFQDSMTEIGSVLVISRMLSGASAEVRKRALAALGCIIDGGNKSAQRELERHFLGTREEHFFIDVGALIELSTESITNLRELRKEKDQADENSRKLQDTMRGTLTKRMLGAKQRGLATTMLGSNVSNVAAAPTHYYPPHGLGSTENTMHSGPTTPALGGQDGQEVTETWQLSDLDLTDPLPTLAPNTDNDVLEEEDKLAMKDHGHLHLVLQLLQAMCEGNNKVLQNYLRCQPDNIRSIDIVEMITRVLGVLVQEISAETTPLIVQCCNTITEFVQGNPLNQRVTLDAHVIDHVNTIIRNNSVMELSERERQLVEATDDANDVIDMDVACAEFMERMLESNDSDTEYVAKESDKILDLPCILKMIRHYMLLQEGVAAAGTKKSDLQLSTVSFVWFTVISRLQHFSHREYTTSEQGASDDWLTRNLADKKAAEKWTLSKTLNKVEANSASVELVVDGIIQKVYFFVDPAWHLQLRTESKEDLLWNIDRGNMMEQTRDFVERSRVIIADMKYMKSVLSSSRTNNFIQNHSNLWGRGMLAVTCIINALMLITWVAPNDNSIVPVYAFTDVLWYTMQALGAVHLVLTFLVSRSYFLANPPSFRSRGSSSPASSTASKSQSDKAALKSRSLDLVRILNTRALFGMEFQTTYSWFTGGSVYHVLLVVTSILGIAFHGYAFCFHLFHIVSGNDILNRVLRAITNQARPLANVAALLLVIIYVYSVIAFAFMRKYFDHEIGAYCDTMYMCFVTSMRLGLLTGGGMGEALPFSSVYSFVEPGVRTLYDLTFFIVVIVIGLNVVFGP